MRAIRAEIPAGAPGYVGGSLGAAAIGYSTFTTELEAYERFMGRAPEPTEEERKRFEFGHKAEDFVARLIQDEYGVRVQRTRYAYIDPDHPWLICHPDRIARMPDGTVFPIEIKTASYFSSRKWGAEESDEMPYQYLIQCYFYFHCNIPNPGWMWQVTFADNQLRRYVVRRDPEIERAIFSRIVDVVENRWMAGIAPAAADYGEATRIWAPAEGTAREADEATAEAVGRLRAVQADLRRLRAEEDALKTAVVEYMQGNETLTYRGERLATYRETAQRRFDSRRFQEDYPELAAEYMTTTSYRTLR